MSWQSHSRVRPVHRPPAPKAGNPMLTPAVIEFEFAIPVPENATMFELQSDVSLDSLNSSITAELLDNHLKVEIDDPKIWELCIESFKKRIFALDISGQLFALDYDSLKISILDLNKVLLSMNLDPELFYKDK